MEDRSAKTKMVKQTESTENKSSATPFLIIGIIAIVTIGGIWMISQSGNSSADDNQNKTATGNTPNRQTNAYANAPAGASPEKFKGSQSASVVVEEFADFQCGACAAKHSVFNETVSNYGNKIKFVFRNYPLIGTHPKAYDAAVALEAAGLQNKFWEMQNLLFANQQTWSSDPNHRSVFKGYAKTIGIDEEKFTNDSLGIVAKNRVDADMKRGNALSLRSTPTVFVNGKSVPFEQMTIDGLKRVIDAELKRIESASKKQTESEEKPSDKKEDEKPESETSEKKTDEK